MKINDEDRWSARRRNENGRRDWLFKFKWGGGDKDFVEEDRISKILGRIGREIDSSENYYRKITNGEVEKLKNWKPRQKKDQVKVVVDNLVDKLEKQDAAAKRKEAKAKEKEAKAKEKELKKAKEKEAKAKKKELKEAKKEYKRRLKSKLKGYYKAGEVKESLGEWYEDIDDLLLDEVTKTQLRGAALNDTQPEDKHNIDCVVKTVEQWTFRCTYKEKDEEKKAEIVLDSRGGDDLYKKLVELKKRAKYDRFRTDLPAWITAWYETFPDSDISGKNIENFIQGVRKSNYNIDNWKADPETGKPSKKIISKKPRNKNDDPMKLRSAILKDPSTFDDFNGLQKAIVKKMIASLQDGLFHDAVELRNTRPERISPNYLPSEVYVRTKTEEDNETKRSFYENFKRENPDTKSVLAAATAYKNFLKTEYEDLTDKTEWKEKAEELGKTYQESMGKVLPLNSTPSAFLANGVTSGKLSAVTFFHVVYVMCREEKQKSKLAQSFAHALRDLFDKSALENHIVAVVEATTAKKTKKNDTTETKKKEVPRSSDEGDSIFNDVSGGESDEQELSDWEDPDSDSEGEEETASFELNREHLCHALAHCGYYSSTVPIKKTLKNAFRAGIVCIEYLVTDVKTPDSWNFSKDFLSKTELGDSENDARKLCNIANKLGPDFRILVENATTANKRISAKNAHTAILKTLNMPRETSDGTDAEDESAEKSSAEAPVPKKKKETSAKKMEENIPAVQV